MSKLDKSLWDFVEVCTLRVYPVAVIFVFDIIVIWGNGTKSSSSLPVLLQWQSQNVISIGIAAIKGNHIIIVIDIFNYWNFYRDR